MNVEDFETTSVIGTIDDNLTIETTDRAAAMDRVRRGQLVGMIAVLFAVSVIVFLIFNVIPGGDPAARIAGKNRTPSKRALLNSALFRDNVAYITHGEENMDTTEMGMIAAIDGYAADRAEAGKAFKTLQVARA